eukprot:6299434-Heterocapsa_arctica.AAC.1
MSDKRELDSPRLDPHEHANFRQYVGKILYAAQVRPDIAYMIKELARRVANPTEDNMRAMRRLV